jgi:glutamine---fructose-6-phosphate transaminase (isomerizing)
VPARRGSVLACRPTARPGAGRRIRGGEDLDAEGFLLDVERTPATLRELAATLVETNPWEPADDAARVILVGMGPSRFAAGVAARRLRARGIDAVAELASAEDLPAAGPGTLAVGISADGGAQETIEALSQFAEAGASTVALTNDSGSGIAEVADRVVPMLAGAEDGGVQCRTVQHALALLLALEARFVALELDVAGVVRDAADASEDLLERRTMWLRPATALLTEGPATFAIAPVERLSSAQQAALALREGPRLIACACETGDWLHVDLYLTKTLDYRALLFAGSRFDPQVAAWIGERGGRVVAVGNEVDGAAQTIRYSGDDDPLVALLSEPLVGEMVAADCWLERGSG